MNQNIKYIIFLTIFVCICLLIFICDITSFDKGYKKGYASGYHECFKNIPGHFKIEYYPRTRKELIRDLKLVSDYEIISLCDYKGDHDHPLNMWNKHNVTIDFCSRY